MGDVPGANKVHPSTVVNDHDHGALINVSAGLFITCSLLFYAVRLLIRWPWKALFGKDDLAITIATVISMVQVVLITSSVLSGTGKVQSALTSESISSIEKMIYASDLLWLLAIYASRLSVALLFFRLTGNKKHLKWCRLISIACGVVCFVAFMLVAVQPKLGSLSPILADGIVARWIVAEVLGNLLEVGLMGFPIYLLSDLQMSLATKAIVLSGFMLRIPLIALSIIRLVYLSKALHSDNFSFVFASAEIFSQAEMCYALVSATLPCLRIFLRATYTGRLGGSVVDIRDDSQMATVGSERLDEKSRRRTLDAQMSDELSSGEHQNLAIVVANARRNDRKKSSSTMSNCSADEDAILIKQTVDVRYDDPAKM